ncbi:phosphorylase superfamily protein [Apiospora saccharicola]
MQTPIHERLLRMSPPTLPRHDQFRSRPRLHRRLGLRPARRAGRRRRDDGRGIRLPPPPLPTDSNLYSFGRIGVHNVVAACLPAGQMGTNSAATVANQMQQSFPSLRFGLLVGIGGGVPRLDDEIDIRLGDVVISQPTGQYGGVVQYDFGKTGPDGRIARTGSLNAPPKILLNALAKLRANDLRGKTQAHSHLSKLTCRPNFVSPGPDQDTLYDASSTHMAGATCAKCRPDDVLDREARATAGPVLFFGTIASGNQVMKDGPTRDRYSQELGGVLCFEMEAAGLMNSFPCLVVRGICDYADAHKNKRWQPYAAATAAAYAKELLSIVPPLAPGDLNGSENSRRKSHFLVPFSRNENFVGREDILGQLLERLPPTAQPNACQRTVIEGLGGIGKTQVAIEAAYHVRQAHPDCSVFWVPAVDMTMFENAYREIGQALEVKGIEDDKADVKALVKAALGRDEVGPWLLIIDNADDTLLLTQGQLVSYLPFNRAGSILFTTRNHQVAACFEARQGTFGLDQLSDPESVQLLHQGLQPNQISDPQRTTELLNYLVYLPLAIRQASAYMVRQMNVTVAKYLEYCTSSDQTMIKMLSKDFDDQDRYQAIRNPVATTWLISFEQISRDDALAADCLRCICYFEEKDIPVTLLPTGADELERDEAISTLRAYAFILDRGTPDRFDVHRLVRLVMRNWVQTWGEQRQQVTDIVWQLSEEFPWPTYETRDMWTWYLPYAQSILGFRDECSERERLGSLQYNVAECYDLLGRYSKAEEMYRETLALRETVLGRGHPSTLASMNNLALVLDSQGKYAEAEEMHRQTLALKGTVLGREHPDTLDSMNNLALVLNSQGKYSEAEEMHREELRLCKKLQGREHPSTLASMNNLALVLDSQGKYSEAEEMHREELRLCKKLRGREHPSTLASMNNLALVLKNQGKYSEAEEMHREELRLCKKLRGREHPSTLASMNNLALVLKNQGKYSEAEEMHRQTLALRETVLGREHPETLKSMMNIGNVLDSQGKYAEAEEMHRQTLALRETVLGREHPDTLASMNNLANVLDSQGKYAEAEEMHRQTLALRETVLGRGHPSTLDSMNNLAIVLGNQGKYEEVAQQQGQAPVGHEDTLAEEHPRTLGSMDSLVEAFSNLRIHSEVSKLK